MKKSMSTKALAVSVAFDGGIIQGKPEMNLEDLRLSAPRFPVPAACASPRFVILLLSIEYTCNARSQFP